MIKLYSQQNVPTGIQTVIIVAQIIINFFFKGRLFSLRLEMTLVEQTTLHVSFKYGIVCIYAGKAGMFV